MSNDDDTVYPSIEIKVGSLVMDKREPGRIGVVCVGAFRMDEGPGAWVLWPAESYEWTALGNLELATSRIGA